VLSLYDLKTAAFRNLDGTVIQDPLLLQANILIELRVLNQLQIELARGNFNVSLEELRVAVVTETTNRST
jgi:hypothetical protein